MKLNCEIIRDLLPLYSDKVCSEESKTAVEEHLKECEPCREELKAIADNKPLSLLRREGGVLIIGKYRRILLSKLLFFAVCAVIFPLLNALIAAWIGDEQNMIFIITAASLLTFVYIPAAVQKKRDLWITVSSVLAPVIMIAATDTAGFVWHYIYHNKSYGADATLGLILSIVPVFIYIIVSVIMFFFNRRKQMLKPFQYRGTAFKIIMIETSIICFCVYMTGLTRMSSSFEGFFRWLILEIFFNLVYIWLAFIVFRFCKGNIFIRLGLYTAILGFLLSTWDTFTYFVNFIQHGGKLPNIEAFWKADFFHPTTQNSSSNTYLTILIISLITAGIFIGIGIARDRKSKKQNKT